MSLLGLAGSVFFATSALVARPLAAAAGAPADRAQPDLLRMVAVMLGLGVVGYLLLAAGQPVAFLIGLVLTSGVLTTLATVALVVVRARGR